MENTVLNLRCPNCDIEISRKVQREMSPFWSAPKPTPCEGCSELIQWHSSLHKKMKLGGDIFRTGTMIFLLSIIPFIFQKITIGFAFIGVGIIVVLIGFFSSATQPEDIKVELANEE